MYKYTLHRLLCNPVRNTLYAHSDKRFKLTAPETPAVLATNGSVRKKCLKVAHLDPNKLNVVKI